MCVCVWGGGGGVSEFVFLKVSGLSLRWSLISVLYHEVGPSGWSLIRMSLFRMVSPTPSLTKMVFLQGVSHQGVSSGWSLQRGLLPRWSFFRGLSPGVLLSEWPLFRMVFLQVDLSSGWSLTRVVSHQGDLLKGWSFFRLISHQGGLSSGWSLIRVVSEQDVLSLG